MAGRPTELQRAALFFIENNPQSTFGEIAYGAGSKSESNENVNAFVQRLVDNGWAQVVLTNEGRDAAGMPW